MNAHAAIITAAVSTAALDYAAFKKALAVLFKTIERKNTIPILATVLIKAGDAGVTLVATDLDIFVTTTVPGAASSDFVVAVNATALKAAVDKVKGASTVHLSRGVHTVALIIGGLRLSLDAAPEADFPVEQDFRTKLQEATVSFLLPTTRLAKALAKTELAVSSEETRYYLNGVFMHIDAHEKHLNLVATDGHKLARYALQIPAGAGAMSDKGAIVPRKTVALLRHLLRGNDVPEHVMVTVTNTAISFLIGEDVLLESKLIDGSFPDYGRVIPTRNEHKVAVSKAPLMAAIRNVSSIAGKKTTLRLAFTPGRLGVSSRDPDTGEASAEVGINHGPELEIGFNAGYLAEIVGVLDGGAMFELQLPGDPATQ